MKSKDYSPYYSIESGRIVWIVYLKDIKWYEIITYYSGNISIMEHNKSLKGYVKLNKLGKLLYGKC